MNKPLIAIVGETASGKSAIALEVAERFNGEIICADSRTIYIGMDIGTAKPSIDERARVPHHLLDVARPDERFTVVDFKRLATQAIEDITSRGKLPILVGGTGLYIDAILFDYSFPETDAARDPLNQRHSLKGAAGSHKELRSNTLVAGIVIEKEVLRQRIEQRIEAMVAAGFVEEITNLYKQYGEVPALQAPGYKAFSAHLNGAISLDEAKALFARNDYQLAKRQRTWFKRNKDIHWVQEPKDIVDLVTSFLRK